MLLDLLLPIPHLRSNLCRIRLYSLRLVSGKLRSLYLRLSYTLQLIRTVIGLRPLPSYLGGGDLDGDVYNVTVDERLHPPRTFPPAGYEPGKRRELDRPSTIDDVADFVVDYIISDVRVLRTNVSQVTHLHQ